MQWISKPATNQLSTHRFGNYRREERIFSIFGRFLIETEQFAGFCLVRNLSPSGMGGVYTSFAEGLAITVQFSPENVVGGTLIWCGDEHIRVGFDEPIDVALVLSDFVRKLVEGMIH